MHGLESRHDLNGKSSTLGAYGSAQGWWAVQVPGYGRGGEKTWARAANLCSVEGLEGRLGTVECTLREVLAEIMSGDGALPMG